MNPILDMLMNAAGGGAVENVGQRFGLSRDQTSSALGQLVPALMAGLQRNTAQPGGMEALLGALTQGNHSRFLDQRLAEAIDELDDLRILKKLDVFIDGARGMPAEFDFVLFGQGEGVLGQGGHRSEEDRDSERSQHCAMSFGNSLAGPVARGGAQRPYTRGAGRPARAPHARPCLQPNQQCMAARLVLPPNLIEQRSGPPGGPGSWSAVEREEVA